MSSGNEDSLIFRALIGCVKCINFEHFTIQTTTSPSNLNYNAPCVSVTYITPHVQENFNFWYFMVIRILFYYSTVGFNQKLYDF